MPEVEPYPYASALESVDGIVGVDVDLAPDERAKLETLLEEIKAEHLKACADDGMYDGAFVLLGAIGMLCSILGIKEG